MRKRYPKYKPTNIPWLKEVPEEWSFEKAKWLFQKENRPVRDIDEVVTAFRNGEVTLRKNRREDGFTNSLLEIGYQGVRKGDLVIHGMDAFAGAIGVSDSDGKATPVYSVCTLRRPGDIHYFCRTIREMARSGFIESLAKGIRERSTDFRFDIFGQQLIPLPPLPDQRAIAAFLDHKCALIDTFIQKKTRLIELLKEQKQALINRAVTRGLDPDVPLKPSGIDWLGDIPEEWEVSKLGYFVNILPGYAFTSDEYSNDENDIRLLRGINVAPNEIRWDEVFYWPKENKRKYERYLLQAGDIVLGMDRPWISSGMRVARISNKDLPCLLLQRVARLRAHLGKMNQDFLEIILKSQLFVDYFSPILTGISVPHISDKQIASFILSIPPIIEQNMIVKYIENESLLIDRTISRIEREIDLIKEYKSALIAEAVTGGIDVRGWEA